MYTQAHCKEFCVSNSIAMRIRSAGNKVQSLFSIVDCGLRFVVVETRGRAVKVDGVRSYTHKSFPLSLETHYEAEAPENCLHDANFSSPNAMHI